MTRRGAVITSIVGSECVQYEPKANNTGGALKRRDGYGLYVPSTKAAKKQGKTPTKIWL
jgi:hypothetical protein